MVRKVAYLGLVLSFLASGCAKQMDLYEYAGLVDPKPTPPPASVVQEGDGEKDVQSVSVLYNKGMDHLKEGSYSAALKDFQEVERVHPYSGWAARALLMQSYTQYLRNENEEAIAIAQRFIRIHPGHKDAGYAHYLIAIGYYEQISDIRRDQLTTRKALAALDEIVEKFPETSYAKDAKIKALSARAHLAGHEMDIGRYYLREHSYLAAINRFKTVIEQYPSSAQAPEALYRLVEAYLALGVLDEAQMAGLLLEKTAPKSDWASEARALLQSKHLSSARHSGSWMERVLGGAE